MSSDENKAGQPELPAELPAELPESFEGNIPPHVEMLTARRISFEIISSVLDHKQALDLVLADHEGFKALTGRDRAFVRMLVTTTMRRLGQIDYFILKASDKDEPPRPAALFNLLRLGTAQIAFMAVPDYAVVDTAVRLAEEMHMGRQKGFVNAVLRRITREHKEWQDRQDAARLNIPEWLMQYWVADYGLREAAEIANACLAEAPLDITIKNPGMAEHWAGELEAQILPTGTLRRMGGGAVQDLSGFNDGMWWVQDASAALPAKLFGDVAGKKILDLCSAPGGKTAQLTALGADVTAVDRSVKRLKRLEENMRRLRMEGSVTIEVADASVWRPKDLADGVLLDAPCSATGTIRRHPDVLYLKGKRDVERLMDIQARLLDNASHMLKSGGVLIYCTCSLQKGEGETQIDRFLSRDESMYRLPLHPEDVSGMDALVTEQGDIRVLPYHYAAHGGMDGFYIARLQKL